MNLSISKINNLYACYKEKAWHSYHKRCFNKCLRYLTAASYTGYSFYLGYSDDEIEDILSSLSKSLLLNDDSEKRHNNICVFYDTFSTDHAGLTQQYLQAIMSCGLKIIYMTEKRGFVKTNSDIKKLLNNYHKVEIIEIPLYKDLWQRSQFIYDRIIETKASKLFIHTHPTSVPAYIAFYALPNSIKKYKINLTDHTYWLGTRFIDYSFEFRQFGCYLSEFKRGISLEKLLCLPYYPIMDNNPFKGFPDAARNKIVIFSGGSYYKIFDKDDIFFKLSKDILDACPEAVLLFAGRGNKDVLQGKINKYELNNRFIPIGRRDDITEVFKHCDIYLNTYPVGGGLMLLYAAHLGKPIVCYRSKTTAGAEDIVCQKKYYKISDDDQPSLVLRMRQLVQNCSERKLHGEKIKECIVPPELFNSLFANYLATGKNRITYEQEINPERHTLNSEDAITYNNISREYQLSIARILRKVAFWECPIWLFEYYMFEIRSRAILKIKRLLKNERHE